MRPPRRPGRLIWGRLIWGRLTWGRLTWNALSVRLVAGALVWSLAALAVGGFVLVQVFRAAAERSLDDRLSVIADNVLGDLTVEPDGGLALKGRLGDARFARVFSGWYWQIDQLTARGATPGSDGIGLLRSRSLWDEVLRIADQGPVGEAGPTYALGPDGETLRMLRQRIDLPGYPDPLVLIVASSVEIMESEIRSFTVILGWALAAMALILALSLLLQVRLVLAPLDEVRTGLARVREGRADRVTGRFPTEIAPLADELNRVLEHNRTVVDRARTQVGNLAHALKTPLSVLGAAAGREDTVLSKAVARETGTMRRQVEHYLARARMAASADVLGTRTMLAPVIGDLVRTLDRLHAERSLAVDVRCPVVWAVRCERLDLEDMVGNLLDNGFKWACSRLTVDAQLKDGMIVLRIGDDGPGLTPHEADAALKRGVRLDETVPGTGLGLAIADDIAQAHRGTLALARSPLGGVEARLSLPAA
ncbi:MAG: sensor histidine kinase [Alphaproteobacteria bacterium]